MLAGQANFNLQVGLSVSPAWVNLQTGVEAGETTAGPSPQALQVVWVYQPRISELAPCFSL